MINLLSKLPFLTNISPRLIYRKCLIRFCSNFNDNSNNGNEGDNSKFKGVRLPGVKDKKNLWKIISYDYEADLQDMIIREADVVIIGGGIIGWSAAYFMKLNTTLNVVVIERDPSHTRNATVLGVGAIRQQFSEPENIQMSLFGAEFLRNVREHLSILDLDPPDIQFHPHGFLTLASDKGFAELEKCFHVQRALGAKVELLSRGDVRSLWPWMVVDDIGGAIHGYENEGWFDAWQLMNAFQRKASSLGAQRIVGEVVGFEFEEHQSLVALSRGGPSGGRVRRPKNVLVRLVDGSVQPIQFAFSVNAGGPWAGDIARLLGMGESGSDAGVMPLPVEPRVQHTFVVSPSRPSTAGGSQSGPTATLPGIDCPLLVDPSGLNVRRDRLGGDFLVWLDRPPLAKRPHKPAKVDEKLAGGETGLAVNFEQFDTVVRPQLVRRIPSMAKAKVRSGWASYLDYNYLDQNLVLGFHPVFTNCLFANGSSGHGIEHSMAIGRALYELVMFAQFRTIDLKSFGFERFYENLPVFEKDTY